MTTTLYPRLTDPQGRVVLTGIRRSGRDIAALRSGAGYDHPSRYFAPTGGIPANREHLESLADAIRSRAEEFGYPVIAGTRGMTTFDKALAEVVFEQTEMSPAEAASPEVWTFMATRLVPDVVMWRWHDSDDVQRWIGRGLVRHAIGRLWWQAYALGVPVEGGGRDYGLLHTMTESDLNQVFEKRSIGGVAPLARALVAELAGTRVAESPAGRREVVRDATKRVRRLIPFTSFLSLDETQIRTRLRDVVSETLTALADEKA